MSHSPLSQRPLQPGDELYVARSDEERKLERALELGLNVAVVGDAGTGKTTLVRRVLGDVPNQQRIVWVDGRGLAVNETVDRIAESFGWIRDRYRLEPKAGTGIVEAIMDRVPIEPDPDRICTDDFPFLANVIADAPKMLDVGEFDSPWVCVLDTLPARAIEVLFGTHRERLWDLPVQWVLISRTNPLPAAAELFFEVKLPLAELPKELAKRLVALRLNVTKPIADLDTDRLVTTIVSQVSHRPRELVAAARDAVIQDAGEAEEQFKRYGELTVRASGLGRGHAMLMSELIAVGGAHASDRELQQRLGYSRPRIVNLLSQLHEAGLVERRPEGRRVVFVPAEQIP